MLSSCIYYWDNTQVIEMSEFKLNDKIVSKANPEWGIWRITKVPTTEEDWYEKWGESGCTILDKSELKFWDKVE